MLEKTEGAHKNKKSRETGYIGHARHITKANKKEEKQQYKKQAITTQKTKTIFGVVLEPFYTLNPPILHFTNENVTR